jgi:kinesin family protein 4/21/27
MAQKESTHREVVDELNTQLNQVRRQLEDLTTLSRDQVECLLCSPVLHTQRFSFQAVNMSTELEGLRGKHIEAVSTLEEIQSQEAALQAALNDAESSHTVEVDLLRSQHQKALDDKSAEVDGLIASLKDEHEGTLATLRDELTAASIALERAHHDHEEVFGKLAEKHEEELHRRVQEANNTLARSRDEHDKSINRITAEHEEVLKQKDAAANAVLQRTEEEYYNALTKLRGDHAEALKRHTSELNATLERLREEHAGELRMAEIAKEGLLSESQSSQISALRELQEEHAAAITRKEASFVEEMENLKAEHVRSLTTQVEDYTLQMDRLRLEHETVLARFKEERRIEVDRSTSALTDAQEASIAASVKYQMESEVAIRTMQEQHATILRELELGHEEEAKQMKHIHEMALKDALAQSDADRTALIQSHMEETLRIKAQHQQEIADVNATLADVQEEHLRSSDAARLQSERLLTEEKERFATSLDELTRRHSEELETLRKEHVPLLQKVDSYKAAQENSDRCLREEKDRLAQSIEDLTQRHSEELETLRKEHTPLLQKVDLYEAAQEDSDRRLQEEKNRLAQTVEGLTQRHAVELETLRKEHELVLQDLNSHKVAADEHSLVREQTQEAHKHDLAQKTTVIEDMEHQLASANEERDELESEVAKLRGELDKTRGEQSKLIQEASKRQSLVDELERHRSVLAETQENLQRVKDEKDTIQAEKMRADALVRDLQAQIARSASPPNGRPVTERNMSYTRSSGLPSLKLPPPTPPPSVPPPPAPRAPGMGSGDAGGSTSSHGSSTITTSVSSRESQPESPATSFGHVPVPPNNSPPVDPKVAARLENQTKQIDEQEAMIKTLNKQLTHCETDLQTHMDLVTTLETSLGDSEKNREHCWLPLLICRDLIVSA